VVPSSPMLLCQLRLARRLLEGRHWLMTGDDLGGAEGHHGDGIGERVVMDVLGHSQLTGDDD